MASVTFQIPWLVVLLAAVFMIIGLIHSLFKSFEVLSLLFNLQHAILREKDITEKKARFISEADRRVKELIDTKVRESWKSLTSVKAFNLQTIRDESQKLIHDISLIYYPSSKRPELEITLSEVMRLQERISEKIYALVSAVPSLNQFSIASILEFKNIYDQTQEFIDEKGIRTGGKWLSRTWQAINIISPQYWINKMIFQGASEMAGRKIITSIYRIVGTEAMQIYRSSSAIRIDKSALEPMQETEIIEEPVIEIIETPQEQPCIQESINEEIEELKVAEIVGLEDDEKNQNKENLAEAEDHPKSMKDKISAGIGDALGKFIEGSLQLWEKLVDPHAIFATYEKLGNPVQSLDEVKNLSPEIRNQAADNYIRKGEWASAAEGAATGVGGVFLLAADAVSLLALQLRMIQQIGYCYGFEVNKPEERLFAVKLLAEAYQHPALQERDALMREMHMAASLLKGKIPFMLLKNRFFTYGLSKVGQAIGIKIAGRKIAQFVPLVGAIAGGYINRRVTKDIALIAKEVYRQRVEE